MPKPKPKAPTSTGARLRAARLARGWTQSDLGLLIGCGKQRICAIEADAVQPSLTWLLRAAVALQVSPARLFPELSDLVTDLDDRIRGRVTLLRCASEPGTWTAEGTGLRQAWVGRTADIGHLIAGLVSEGIEVTAPPLPPIE